MANDCGTAINKWVDMWRRQVLGSRDAALALQAEFVKQGSSDNFANLPDEIREAIQEEVRMFRENGEIQQNYHQKREGLVDTSEQMKTFVEILRRGGIV